MIKDAGNKQDVGIVLCDCGRTLRDRIDFVKLHEYLGELEGVFNVRCCSGFCKPKENTNVIKSLIKNKQTKRLVIGACDQEVFEKALTETVKNVGLNTGLLWSVNIREHCAWIAGTKRTATDKAKDILTTAVQRIKLDSALKQKSVRVNQNVLVLGGGLAAMQTAIALSQLGHLVTLIESLERLGGLAVKMPQLYAYLASNSSNAEELVRNRVEELIGQVKKNRRIHIELSSKLKSLDGELGNFTAVVTSKDSEQRIPAGAIVIAMDSIPMQTELVELTNNTRDVPKRIAIILDILAEQGRGISARVLSAAEILVNRFKADVKLYCHNIRVAATGMEGLYRRTRQAGVSVVKYDSVPMILEKGSKKLVSVEDPVTGIQVNEEFDLVIIADVNLEKINNELLKLIDGLHPVSNRQLQADNVWLNPTQTNLEGLFILGSMPDTIELRDIQTDGLATANEIHELLKDKKIDFFDDAATVDIDKCVLCLTCMRICPHGAINIDEENKTASVSIVTCQRCGMCAAECPAGAIQLPRYTDQQILIEIGNKPKITVFACENSAYPAATVAGISGLQWKKGVQLIRVPCAGKVDPRDVLQALESGAKEVMILGCHLENCQYL
ncbi:MAG: hypothetical protein AMJ75_07020, partial [Phycisphaerae bacterium SM1_79]